MSATGPLGRGRNSDEDQRSFGRLVISEVQPLLQGIVEPVPGARVTIVVVELNVEVVHEISRLLQTLKRELMFQKCYFWLAKL